MGRFLHPEDDRWGGEMHVEGMMFVGWTAMPAVAYVVAKAAIWWSDKHAEPLHRAEADRRARQRAARLESGTGRGAVSMRLIDGPVGSSARAPRS